jgi:hypothetical protein
MAIAGQQNLDDGGNEKIQSDGGADVAGCCCNLCAYCTDTLPEQFTCEVSGVIIDPACRGGVFDIGSKLDQTSLDGTFTLTRSDLLLYQGHYGSPCQWFYFEDPGVAVSGNTYDTGTPRCDPSLLIEQLKFYIVLNRRASGDFEFEIHGGRSTSDGGAGYVLFYKIIASTDCNATLNATNLYTPPEPLTQRGSYGTVTLTPV